MKATRIEYDGDGIPAPGTYFKLGYEWHAMTPNGHMANLAAHSIEEHDDGTITVSPSILVSRPPFQPCLWHGYLEHGVWREC